jgi:hypothetical protein
MNLYLLGDGLGCADRFTSLHSSLYPLSDAGSLFLPETTRIEVQIRHLGLFYQDLDAFGIIGNSN